MNVANYFELEYADRGRGPRCYDCWGLFQLLYRLELGIELPSYDERYASAQQGQDVESVIHKEIAHWRPIKYPEPFSLLIFRVAGKEQHCGCALDGYNFIHMFRGQNVAVEPIYGRRWRKRFAGAYRYI